MKITSPEVGICIFIIVFTSVDLPQPDSPTMPTVSPALILRLTSSQAVKNLLLLAGNF